MAAVCCPIRIVLRDIWADFINFKQTFFYIYIPSITVTVVASMMNMRILLNREPVNCEAPESWEKIRNKHFLHSSIYYVNTQLTNDFIFFALKFAHNSFVTFIHKWQTTLNRCSSYMLHIYSPYSTLRTHQFNVCKFIIIIVFLSDSNLVCKTANIAAGVQFDSFPNFHI